MTREFRPIDAGMLKFYATLSAESPPESVNWPLPEQRRGWDGVCAKFRAPRPAGLIVEDLRVPRDGGGEVGIRLYRPRGHKLLPAVMYLHGGGWVLGSLETHDDVCAEIADQAQVCVIAVDYRLAPEHPHPAQLEDNLAVLKWMRDEGMNYGFDPARIVAAGDSAGGQMSACLALWLRDHDGPQLDGMVLIYPVLGSSTDTPSYHTNADAPCLTRSDMIYYLDAVPGPHGSPAWNDPYAMPLHADHLHDLPPTFITAAAHDPLFDDALIYQTRLMEAGVAVKVRIEPELTHSYMRARHVSGPAGAGFAAIVEAVRSLSHSQHLPG